MERYFNTAFHHLVRYQTDQKKTKTNYNFTQTTLTQIIITVKLRNNEFVIFVGCGFNENNQMYMYIYIYTSSPHGAFQNLFTSIYRVRQLRVLESPLERLTY